MKANNPTKAQRKATAIIILRRISDTLNSVCSEIGNDDAFNALQAQTAKIDLAIDKIIEI